MRALKYLLALQVPVLVGLSLYLPGIWSFTVLIYAFGLIPLVELVFKGSDKNLNDIEEEVARKDSLYDLMIYINVPVQLGLMAYFLYLMAYVDLSYTELIGNTIAMGLSCTSLGINVAHELGHRKASHEQFMAKILLWSTSYMHFIIEHNLGHHKRVSTDEDPASSFKGQTLYAFLPRSIIGGYFSAWSLERARLERKELKFWSINNEMIRFTVIQLITLVLIAWFLGPVALIGFVLASIIGFTLLEVVNYIEHYGLRREKKESGNYERVMPHHSWNSNHSYGRLVLYEITRHSDHHYLASRPYQILRHFDDTPQMPTGYPGMMLLSIFPPLWFKIMNPKVDAIMQGNQHEIA
jgi:alkane 1-monooxygenase